MKEAAKLGDTVFLMVVLPALLLTAAGSASQSGPDDEARLTLERIFTDKEFEAKGFGPARWLADSSGYTTLEENDACNGARDVVKYDPQTQRREVLISADQLIPTDANQPLHISDYAWSSDQEKLLIFTNTRRVWRRHTRGDYWVLDRKSGRLAQLGGDADESYLMFAKFSPESDAVAYVYRNNVYIQNLKTMRIRQLTHDGSETIINGTGDWVNEEEFGIRDGFRFSPDGRYIAFWRFDTSGVGRFKLINYTESLYPTITDFPYPKVGQVNSECRIGVVSVSGGKPALLPNPADPRNSYIPRMQWVPDSKCVVIQHLDRLQHRLQVIRYSVEDRWFGSPEMGRPETVFTDFDDGWIEMHGDLRWIDDGRRFIRLSERDGWRHIWLVSTNNHRVRLLTPGAYDVISIQAVDEDEGWVYFIASVDNPTQRYLHRVPLDGTGQRHRITPSDQPGTHSYKISPDAKWAIHTYTTFDRPAVIDLVSLDIHQRFRLLEGNEDLQEKIDKLDMPASEFFRVDIGDGVLLDAWCIKPPDFDPRKRYPVFFYVYGEPAGQTVLDRWGGQKHLWHCMLAQQGYVVMSVDNRGTPSPRGRDWRKCVYRQIGILASADQAAAVRAIADQRPHVDPNRIGVWGWSGGGSMTLNALLRYPDLYTTGMAIAFVANQRYYDTIYQERYMGLPRDNDEGYRQGSPITFADQLQGNLLLLYGTGDDNCHYQNCQVMINAFVKHNKQFSLVSYPNRTHGISEGPGTRRHLYETMTHYLTEHLPIKEQSMTED